MWSSKLMQSLRMLGHEPMSPSADSKDVTVAIVNLSWRPSGSRSRIGAVAEPISTEEEPVRALIRELHDRGIKVIAHAGHKEKDLFEMGKAVGADVLATNGEI